MASVFEAEAFLENENLTVQDLSSLQKVQLREVLNCLKITMPLAARKDALVQAIATHLSLEIDDEQDGSSADSSIELEKFKLELEFKKAEAEKLQERERERELQEREKERELQEREREREISRKLRTSGKLPEVAVK